MRSKLKCIPIFANEKAAAAIEFAMILPVMLLMMLPVYDFFSLILLQHKLNKMVATIGDAVSLNQSASGTRMSNTTTTAADVRDNAFIMTRQRLRDQIVIPAQRIMCPVAPCPREFPSHPDDRVRVFAIYKSINIVRQPWTANYSSGGFSVVNTPGSPVVDAVPGSFQNGMYDNEGTIVILGTAHFQPVLNLIGYGILGLEPHRISANGYYPARNGPLMFVWG